MAEFRKREDIRQEIDILQTWQEMGAPRMVDLDASLRSLVRSVDPALMRLAEELPPGTGELPEEPVRRPEPPKPRTFEMPEDLAAGEPPQGPPEGPSPFADLPPGDEEDREPRSRLLPAIGLLLVGGAGLAYLLTRYEPLNHGHRPAPGPTGGHGAKQTPGAKPSAGRATPGHAKPSATAEAVVPTATPHHAGTLAPTHEPATATPRRAASTHAAATPGHAGATGTPGHNAPSHAVTATPGHAETPSHHATAAPHKGGLTTAHPHVLEAARHSPRAVVREYHVHAGDSLSAIARDQLGDMHRWHEIYDANRDQIANPDLIEAGTDLHMPGAAPTYHVKPGDTLKAIATARLGDAGRWREIYELNRDQLHSPGVLPPGLTLKLPDTAAATGNAAPRTQALNTAVATHHTVRAGDSLSLLARRYLGSERRWAEIYYLNSHKIANPHWIYPGQVLAIPAPGRGSHLKYVVRSGDSLWAIARREAGGPLRWTRIYHANRDQIRNPHWIYPGQVFRIP